ncbi:hypothetical protein [Clostridium sp.]
MTPCEIWNQICTFNYEALKLDAIEESNFLVVSLEKLLFLKAISNLEMVVDLVLKQAFQILKYLQKSVQTFPMMKQYKLY